MTDPEETVMFLGKKYAVKDLDHPIVDTDTKDLLDLGWNTWSECFVAFPTGKLEDLNIVVNAATPQAAATALEKACIKDFRRIGRALGYTVTG